MGADLMMLYCILVSDRLLIILIQKLVMCTFGFYGHVLTFMVFVVL